jgi:hypothetical protein
MGRRRIGAHFGVPCAGKGRVVASTKSKRRTAVARRKPAPKVPLGVDPPSLPWLVATLRDALRAVGGDEATRAICDVLGPRAAQSKNSDAAAAFEMAKIGVHALLADDEDARAQVREWDAHRQRASGVDSQALTIMAIGWRVVVAASRRRHGRDANAAEALRAWLVQQFGEKVPAIGDLEDWLACHARRHAPGQLTTSGVVGRIVHRSRLLGVHHDDEQKTIQRVRKVLLRHQGGALASPPKSGATRV